MHKNSKFSKLGYILAMAGSAIGLGTAWKFPTMVGNNGGFAFIFLYIILTISIGAAAFLAEASIGKATGKEATLALKELAHKNKNFWKTGGLFTFVGICITPFYLVIIGWIFYYAFSCLWGLPKTNEEAKEVFTTLITQDILSVCISFLVVFTLAFYTISKGFKQGIEKLNLILMPSLFILLISLVIYSSLNGNFTQALNFIFYPDFSKILHSDLLLNTLGLSMFSMSLGMCTVCAYASNTSEDTNLFKSVFYIIFLNTLVGILMGLIVFSFIPISNTAQGPGLVFISLASLFGSLGFAGQIVGFAFFSSLIFAGITSAVSIIEPSIMYLTSNYKFSRTKALAICAIFVLVVGFICIFSYYKPSANMLSFWDKSILDWLDFITSNILMPLGALFFSVFIGWFAPKEKIYLVFIKFTPKWLIDFWYYIVKFIVPICIIGVGVYNLI